MPVDIHRWLTLPLSCLVFGIVGGCSLLSGDKVDYAANAKRTQPLEVPPDLTQLARESRYLPQTGGPVSASSYAAQPAPPGPGAPATAAGVAAPAAVAPAAPAAAPASLVAARIEGSGSQRRIVTPLTRQQLWPQLQSYWQDLGFTLTRDDMNAGTLETDWTDLRNTAKQKEGVLGTLRSLFASGERDKFVTRVEATPTGTAIYLAHQSVVATYANANVVDAKLEPRPADPEVEAKYLTFMLEQLNKSMPVALARPPDAVAPVLSAAPQSARLPELGVPAAPAAVLPAAKRARLEGSGTQRWVVTPATREELWPRLQSFWQDLGFKLISDDAAQGQMETDWAELRSTKRQTSGVSGFLGSIFSTGQREKFRVRVETTAAGNEVYLSHQSAAQVYTNANVVEATLEPRPASPELEAEYLAFLVEQLNKAPAPAQAAPAAAAASAPAVAATLAATLAATPVAAPAPVVPERARMIGESASTIEIDDAFDRAWRRVGIALDRAGFTVEDRDRAGGLYFVRYIDPKAAKQEGPGFFSRLFGAKAPSNQPARYRIALESTGAKTAVSVRSAPGVSDDGSTRQTIAARLLDELRK